MVKGKDKTKIEKPPFLVIGCGGNGYKIIRLLIEKYFEQVGSYDKLDSLPIRLLSIDTLTKPEGRSGLSLRDEDYLSLGPIQLDTFLQKYYRDENLINNWLNDKQYAGLMSTGAMQIRPFGRLALFIKLFQVVDRINKKIRDVIDKTHVFPEETEDAIFQFDDRASLQVHLVGSIAGGTGSGIMLDLAYLLRHICPCPITITSHLIMPETVSDIQIRDSLYANSYAFLKELDNFNHNPHLYAKSSPIYSYLRSKEHGSGRKVSNGPNSDADIIKRPFDYIYLLSPFTLGSSCLKDDFFREIISEKLFISSWNEIGDRELERAVNIQADVLNQLYRSKNLSKGKLCQYGSYGVSVLRVREKVVKSKIREYLLNKIKRSCRPLDSEESLYFDGDIKLIEEIMKTVKLDINYEDLGENEEWAIYKKNLKKVFEAFDIGKAVKASGGKLLKVLLAIFSEKGGVPKIFVPFSGEIPTPRIAIASDFDRLEDEEIFTYDDPDETSRNLVKNLELNIYLAVEEECGKITKITNNINKWIDSQMPNTGMHPFGSSRYLEKEFDNILFYNFPVDYLTNYIEENEKNISVGTFEEPNELATVINAYDPMENINNQNDLQNLIDNKVNKIWSIFATIFRKQEELQPDEPMTVSNFLKIMFADDSTKLDDILSSFVSVATPCWRYNDHFSKFVHTISLIGCTNDNYLLQKIKGGSFFGSTLENTGLEEDPFDIPLVISQYGLPLLGYENLVEYKKSYLTMRKKFEVNGTDNQSLFGRQFHLDKSWEEKDSILIDPFEDVAESFINHFKGQLFSFAWYLTVITKNDKHVFSISMSGDKEPLNRKGETGVSEALSMFIQLISKDTRIEAVITDMIWNLVQDEDIDVKEELNKFIDKTLENEKEISSDEEDRRTMLKLIAYIKIFIDNSYRLLPQLKENLQDILKDIELN